MSLDNELDREERGSGGNCGGSDETGVDGRDLVEPLEDGRDG
jgi:hypothetical protein